MKQEIYAILPDSVESESDPTYYYYYNVLYSNTNASFRSKKCNKDNFWFSLDPE